MTSNEPEMHSFLTESFAAMPSAGSLPVAETLVLELFREIFFEYHSESNLDKPLDPNETNKIGKQVFSKEEKAILYMLMGRKRNRNRKSRDSQKPFFAPAYPYLARNSWLGEKRKRIIYQFFLGGPLAQHLWQGGDKLDNQNKHKELAEVLIEALSGSKSITDSMYISLLPENNLACHERDKAIERVKERTKYGLQLFKLPNSYSKDELATQIYQDLYAICDLEKDIPRMQWIQIFMTFLRFSIPIWVLAQMETTIIIYKYIEKIYTEGFVLDEQKIVTSILQRNREIIIPSSEYHRDFISISIEDYMKCRIKLNILLKELGERNIIHYVNEKSLNLLDNESNNIGLVKFLSDISKTKDEFSKQVKKEGYSSPINFICRKSEDFSAFYTPTKSGSGRNIKQLCQILYKGHIGEYFGGYLLSGKSGSLSGPAKIFPGPGLIKVMLFLALKQKRKESPRMNTKNLVLEDIENHFSKYGVDFTKTAETRNLLMTNLKDMGLLTGSPDAGSSVAVASPFQGGR